MVTTKSFVFAGCEKNHILKIERQIDNLKSKIDALKLQHRLWELGVKINIKLEKNHIIKTYESDLCRKDNKGKIYIYCNKNSDYIRTRWTEIALEFDMLISDFERGDVFLRQPNMEVISI
jgi:hypothetical protein